MKIKLYGVRGSLPTPTTNREYRKKVYEILRLAIQKQLSDEKLIDTFFQNLPSHLTYLTGGNTTCVRIRTESQIYILDAGTGIKVLGDEIIKNQKNYPQTLHIFLTHTHWDHIQGLPFFVPLYLPQYNINFYSGFPDIQERLIYQTEEKFFPVKFENTSSQKKFYHLKVKEPLILNNELEIHTFPLKHPGGCYAYKFINLKNNKIFIFATDVEFRGSDFLMQRELLDFFGYADILIIDSQYTLDESFMKIDWGHTSYTMAVNCAVHWKVKNLVLTHHDPNYEDEKIYNNYLNAIMHRRHLREDRPKIFLAREDLEFML